MNCRSLRLFWVPSFLLTCFAWNASISGATAQTPLPVVRKIDAALNVPALKNAVVGALIKSLDDDQTIYQRNPDTALMPASNNKLLTAAAALSLLGSDYRYATALYRTGEIPADGNFTGDLWIKGSGDPSFSSTDLLALAKALKAAGVIRFSGRVIADESKFDDVRLADGWAWDNEPYYYQAQVSALNCDENVIELQARPGEKPGDPARITLGGAKSESLGFAGTNYVLVRNAVTTIPATARPATPFAVDRERAGNLIRLSGEIPMGVKDVIDSVTVEDPALFTAYRLWELLPLAGINVPAPDARRVGKGVIPRDAALLASHLSPKMSDLLPAFLKPSDNLYGECLLKTIAAEKAGQGTFNEGAKQVKAFLMDAGVSVAGLYQRDGSGLTRLDNVTPRTLVELLTHIDRKFPPQRRAIFYDALPVGGKEDDYINGVPSTLRLRYRGTPLAGRVHAKTGSLNGVSCLSGYVTTPGGKRYVFSLMMNHFAANGSAAPVRAAQDAVLLLLP